MEAIGKTALKVVSEWTDSPRHSEQSLVAKPDLRLPKTTEEARALHEWATSPAPAPEKAAVKEISRHLAFIAATLPSRSQDEESGKMRVAVYSRILEDFSNEALSFMSRRACETLDWFPTPRQCLDILAEYREPSTGRDQALMLCHTYAQQQFEDFIDTFRRGEATEATFAHVPDQWRRIAVERGYLRYVPDGGYAIRAQAQPAAEPEALAG